MRSCADEGHSKEWRGPLLFAGAFSDLVVTLPAQGPPQFEKDEAIETTRGKFREFDQPVAEDFALSVIHCKDSGN
jgi:hypothetical protein